MATIKDFEEQFNIVERLIHMELRMQFLSGYITENSSILSDRLKEGLLNPDVSKDNHQSFYRK